MTRNTDEELDKLLATYTFRLPEYTKGLTSVLSKYWKDKLNQELLMTVARVLHEANFDPSRYLKE